MKLRIFVYIVILYFLIMIQTTLAEYISILDVKPNLLLIFIVSAALLRGRAEGAFLGVAAGFLMDIFSGGIFGVYMLAGLYAGYLNGSVNQRLYRENYLVIIFFTFITTIFFETLVYFMNIFLFNIGIRVQMQTDFLFALINVILPETIYNVIISIPFYALFTKLNRWLDIERKKIAKY
jgi:rod shape-determining protein MreD